MDQSQIGRFIAVCRRDKNLTQKQLAETLGVTNKSVSKWENGSCLPDASLYEPLCIILGITINELFAGQKTDADNTRRASDTLLLQMLMHRLYRSGDKSISYADFENALNKMSEVTAALKQFESKDKAVEYLVRGTNLSAEECLAAYDYYISMFDTI